MNAEEIERRFKYHAPDESKIIRHEKVRDICKTLAIYFNSELSDNREKSLAITKLEEVMYWANASIARTE